LLIFSSFCRREALDNTRRRNWLVSVSMGPHRSSIIWAAESHRALLARFRQEERTRQLLTDELAHRVKNTLAVVQAIINYSVLDQPELREKIGARITALAKTNEILISSQTCPTSFKQVLRAELEPFDLARFRLAGAFIRSTLVKTRKQLAWPWTSDAPLAASMLRRTYQGLLPLPFFVRDHGMRQRSASSKVKFRFRICRADYWNDQASDMIVTTPQRGALKNAR
jgi:hypothetical protein